MISRAVRGARLCICESSRGLGELALEALISKRCRVAARRSRLGICGSSRGLGEPALEALISKTVRGGG
jgi:hypothetical protein